MFDFFNPKHNFETAIRELEERFTAAFESFKEAQVMPIVTQQDDVTTVTFKGPNVTTTITTKTAELPNVLKQYGLVMPTVARKSKNAKS
jgi:hypothetical protein